MPIPSAEGSTWQMVLLAHRKSVGYRAKKSHQDRLSDDYSNCLSAMYWLLASLTSHHLDFCDICLFLFSAFSLSDTVKHCSQSLFLCDLLKR